MNRISARTRIAIGLVALLVSVLLLALALGLMPSQRDALVDARAKLCESMAVATSALAARGDSTALEATLAGIVGRNGDLISAAVRDPNEKLIAVAGDHEANWKKADSSEAVDVYVPIFNGDSRWGTMEMHFKPIAGKGIVGFLSRPAPRLITFVCVISFFAFMMYLRKVLQHLDPSKVVPGRVRSALDTLAEGLLVMDNQERVMLANNAFAEIAGRTPDALMGTRVSQLPWVDEDVVKPWTAAIKESQPQRNVTLRLRHADGQVRSFVVNCSPVLGQDGKHRGVLASFEDITVLEAQKVELNKSKEAAEAANRSKSEFLARMSHEIRTPMNAILGFADVLRRGFEESETERQEYLETIHASGQHLLDLINDILDLSKIESGKIQIEPMRCSPHQIITETINVLRVRAKQKGLALEYTWDGGLPISVVTDPTRLRQILTNLIGNAVKFTEKGGVKVVARLAGDEKQPKLAIDVIDSGIGIRPEDMNKLFQAFVQADTSITRRFGGTGLGLAISRQLAEAMGGGITVASEYGKGTTFTCTIDTGSLDGITILEAPPAGGTLPRDLQDPASLRLPPLRVLSVDDGTSNQKLISLVLQRAGVASIETAANGKIGVELASRKSYDIILMDMQMPVMDGYAATAQLRKQGITTPIVALTAHAMKSEEDKTKAIGCNAYLPKPIDIDLLVQTVANCVSAPIAMEAQPARPAPVKTAKADALKSTLPTDDPDFREIVDEFVKRLSEQMGQLQSAWEQRELSQVASLAHWLKGSGGTAGFDAFTAPARRLEQLAKSETQLDEIERTVREIQELATRVASATEVQAEVKI